jgi:hypothetical protein
MAAHDGKLPRDRALALLFQERADLEDRGQNIAQAPDRRDDAPDMIEHIVEVRPHLRIEIGEIEMDELAHHLAHGSEDTLEFDQLMAQLEKPRHICATEKRVERLPLHLQHFVLDRLGDRKIAVDDEVEHGMKHIVDAMGQQRRVRLEMGAQIGMDARGAVPDRNDMGRADEDRGFCGRRSRMKTERPIRDAAAMRLPRLGERCPAPSTTRSPSSSGSC